MKQNERLLVYLVTGFLAVILLVAVFFGRDTQAAKREPVNKERIGDAPVRNLAEILNRNAGNAEDGPAAGDPKAGNPPASNDGGEGGKSGESGGDGTAEEGSPESGRAPLIAQTPRVAVDLVVEFLGASRRDRTVRIVRARHGDSLESLVRRWCGQRSPFLEEAKSLNEDLSIVRIGQEVVVPWVDDELVLAAYEARQPMLMGEAGKPQPALQPVGAGPQSGPPSGPPSAPPSGLSFREPGAGGVSAADPNANAAAVGTKTYEVKPGDSYWKIAQSLYGKGKAPAMVKEIRRLNPDASDVLQIKQQLTVPMQ